MPLPVPLHPGASLGPLSHNPKLLEGSVASQPRPSCWPVAVPSYWLSLELLIALNSLGSLGEREGQQQSSHVQGSQRQDSSERKASALPLLLPSQQGAGVQVLAL